MDDFRFFFFFFFGWKKDTHFIFQGQSRGVGGVGLESAFRDCHFAHFGRSLAAQDGAVIFGCIAVWSVDVFNGLADILLPVTCLATSTLPASPCKVTLFLPLITLSRAILDSVDDEWNSFFFCFNCFSLVVDHQI